MKLVVVSHSYIVDLNLDKLREMVKQADDSDVTVVVPESWYIGGVHSIILHPTEISEERLLRVPIKNYSRNQQGLLCFGIDYLRLLSRLNPDIVQVEQGSRSLAYLQTILFNKMRGRRTKHVFFTPWNIPYNLKFPASGLEWFNLSNTDGAFTCAVDGISTLRQRGYKGPIALIPQLGVNLEKFSPNKDKSASRQKLSIAPDDFVCGFLGRFIKEKGLVTLINSFGRLIELLPDKPLKLLLVGDGPMRQDIEQLLKEKGLLGRTLLPGPQPHVLIPEMLACMNALVVPSETNWDFKTLTAKGWKEQFGHVLIEAMACGVPVIGSDSGEIPNVVAETGLIFPEGNAEALSVALIQLIERTELCEILAQLGLKRVADEFSNQALAKKHLQFFASIMES